MPAETVDGPLTLALIGAGRAGRPFAAAAVRAGHRVLLEDVLPSRLREALDAIPTAGMSGSLELVTTVEDAVRDADIAIDFVPDELESKLEIACLVDRMAPPRTILCLQTRSLGITDLAGCTYRPDRAVGLTIDDDRVTVIGGRDTSAATLARAVRFFRSITADVLVTHDPAAK